MKNNDHFCCALTSDREIMKTELLSIADQMTTEALQTLYIKALSISEEAKAASVAKYKMIAYMVDRMEQASTDRVRTLFLCATNIL